MIEGLKPYAEYKESGQEWLGCVPAHWDLRRTKLILREVDSRSTTGKEQLLRVSQYTGVTQRKAADGSDAPDTRAASLVGYKRVSVNDLVINIMLAWNGSMGVSRFDGIASPAYCVYRLNKGAQPWYFHQLFRLPLYKGRIKAVSTGVIESRLRLYSDDLGRIEAILPPPDEQAAIVRFLDHANRKIDGFIRAKRKLIGLLNEQKQAIIHNAVTRGLNPDVPLKPSGIPWLGEIPGHWGIRPLKQTLLRMDYGTSESSTGDGKYRVLTMGHIQNGRVLVPDEGGINEIPAGLSLKTNDLLFNRTNSPELVGKVGIFSGSNEPSVTFASYLVRLRVRAEHNPSWLNYLLNSFRFWAFARSQALVSLHQANLNSSRYGRMNIPVPPRQDQDSIVENIYTQTSAIDTAIARTEREIALMQEYRTRLTADLVTGKLDVRDAAAELPVGGEASDLSDRSDVSDESDLSDLSDLSDETTLEDAP